MDGRTFLDFKIRFSSNQHRKSCKVFYILYFKSQFPSHANFKIKMCVHKHTMTFKTFTCVDQYWHTDVENCIKRMFFILLPFFFLFFLLFLQSKFIHWSSLFLLLLHRDNGGKHLNGLIFDLPVFFKCHMSK